MKILVLKYIYTWDIYYIYIYVYIPKSCNLQLMVSLSLLSRALEIVNSLELKIQGRNRIPSRFAWRNRIPSRFAWQEKKRIRLFLNYASNSFRLASIKKKTFFYAIGTEYYKKKFCLQRIRISNYDQLDPQHSLLRWMHVFNPFKTRKF